MKYSIRDDIGIEEVMKNKWQKILDLISELINIPVALIMRLHAQEIEVFAKSSNSNNTFQEGEKQPLNTGLYCETVLDTLRPLNVPNALLDSKWQHSPDAKCGMIAYLGFPIVWPSGELFGTICILDSKERFFEDWNKKLLSQYADIIQDELGILIAQQNLEKEIAEHIKTVNALRESEERFKKAFQTSIAGILITNEIDGKIINANEGYSILSGYSYQELLGKTTTELGLYRNPQERQHIIQKLRHNEPVNNFQLSLRTKSGDMKIVEGSVKKIEMDHENRLLATIYDITPLKKLENNLRLLNERYTLSIRAAQAGIWDWDIVNNVLIWDNQTYKLYGAGEDFAGNYEAWVARLHPEDLYRSKQEIRQALSGEREYDTEFRICMPDGSIKYIKTYGDVIRNEGVPTRMVGIDLDITEKKQLENALIASDQLYKDLFNKTSAVRLVVHAETGVIFDVNSAAIEFYRYPKEYLIGKSATEINGLSLSETLENLGKAYSDQNDYYQAKHRLANGEIRDVEVFNGPIDINGQKYVNCIIHDISQRKSIEEQLQESEARYRNLFHNNYSIQLIIDSENGDIIDANTAACVYYGLIKEELKGKKLWDINPSEIDFILKKLRETFLHGSDLVYTKHKRSNGEIRDVEVFSGRAEMNGHKYVHEIIHDITERKRAENELIESEMRFRLYVENSPDCIYVEIDSRLAYVNRKFVTLLGAESESDLIGRYIPDLFSSASYDHIKQYIRTLNEEKEGVSLKEETIVRLDGTNIDTEISAVPFTFEGQNGALIYLRDITERRNYEKSKLEMEAQIRQKQKLESMGTLAGGVAHEINNPINGIINYAQLIIDSNNSDIQQKEYAGEIIHEGMRVAEIVKNLLNFARQEKQTHSPAQINDIVNQTISLIRTIIRHDQISMEINIPEDLPSIKCRSQQIQQVLMNLITNARDALNARYKGFDENKKIILNCEMFKKGNRRWLKIVVEDHGTGIQDTILDKVFDPFFTTKPHEKGTGLGLSVSHGIVKDHHGELYFETEPGEFTKAIVELPVDNGWELE